MGVQNFWKHTCKYRTTNSKIFLAAIDKKITFAQK